MYLSYPTPYFIFMILILLLNFFLVCVLIHCCFFLFSPFVIVFLIVLISSRLSCSLLSFLRSLVLFYFLNSASFSFLLQLLYFFPFPSIQLVFHSIIFLFFSPLCILNWCSFTCSHCFFLNEIGHMVNHCFAYYTIIVVSLKYPWDWITLSFKAVYWSSIICNHPCLPVIHKMRTTLSYIHNARLSVCLSVCSHL
jgi:hypothetical protein